MVDFAEENVDSFNLGRGVDAVFHRHFRHKAADFGQLAEVPFNQPVFVDAVSRLFLRRNNPSVVRQGIAAEKIVKFCFKFNVQRHFVDSQIYFVPETVDGNQRQQVVNGFFRILNTAAGFGTDQNFQVNIRIFVIKVSGAGTAENNLPDLQRRYVGNGLSDKEIGGIEQLLSYVFIHPAFEVKNHRVEKFLRFCNFFGQLGDFERITHFSAS